jgi:hypothetical protein
LPGLFSTAGEAGPDHPVTMFPVADAGGVHSAQTGGGADPKMPHAMTVLNR